VAHILNGLVGEKYSVAGQGTKMNSSIALRLLWKEYRVQRGLWLSMAGGSIMLQALIAFLVPSDQESFQGIVPVAFMLTFFYAIGSGAITFAIEWEEGTQLRPVMLGCPPGLTLTVKTIFGIVTTALLLATTICSGLLLSTGSLTLPPNTFPVHAQGTIIPLALLFVALPYLGSLLWSTFFSLLTRKVIVALGLAAVAMIGSYIVVAMSSIAMFENGRGQYQSQLTAPKLFVAALVPCSLALLLLAVNYLLTHRWLTRAFFDQTSSKSPSFFKRWRIRRSGLDGGMVVEIGVEDRTAFEVVSPEVAVHQPPPRFGLSLLYAMWGPNLLRHLMFLRWREAIETRKIFVGFLLATLVLTVWVVGENINRNGWHVVVAIFIHGACVACGVMAFRAEQDDRKVQRLADMGLRPTTVWVSKHLVWFVRAVMSVFAILLCAVVAAESFRHPQLSQHVGFFMDQAWLNQQLPNSMPNYDPGIRLFGRAVILTLTMYSIGQACSQLIRSTIVCGFVGFILGLTAFGWAATCWYFGVPFILSVLPLAIGCLLVTWCRTKSWMIDDNRGRAWLRPTAAITAALAVIYFGTGLFRVYEIPWSKPFFSDGSSAEFDDGLTDEQRATVVAPVTDEEIATFQLYQRASELTRRNSYWLREGRETAEEIWSDLSEEDQQATEQAIQLALEAAVQPACATFSPEDTNLADVARYKDGDPFWDSVELILFDAQQEIDKGNVDVALDRYRSALTASRHAAGRSGEFRWWVSHSCSVQVLRGLCGWAEHPDVDKELVDEAIRMIDDHRSQMIPIEVTNFATALMVWNTLNADAFTIAESGRDSERLPILLATKFPGESSRSRRLLNALESYDVNSLVSFRSQQTAAATGVGIGMKQWFQQTSVADSELEETVRFSVRTTPLLAMIAGGPVRGGLCVKDVSTECDIRATKIAMRLLQKQRESHELPVTLDEFGASWNDPWTDKPYTWYPEGLPGNLINGSQVIVDANTPFLMTTGKRQITLRRVEYHENDEFYPGMEHSSTVIRDKPTEADLKEPSDGIVRVEFRAEGDEQIPAAELRVWKISNNAGIGEVSNSSEAK
jgi:hypothetical protein